MRSDRLDQAGVRVAGDQADSGEAAMEEVTARGLNPLTSLVRRSSLEDVFLRLTGRSLID